jgi:ATP-dependent DNA helicase RecG
VEFSNNGTFMPGNVENVIKRKNRGGARNPAMMELMTRLGMTEEAGRGIIRMFRAQQERLFPMPEYDLSEEDWVKVTIYGKDIDQTYREILLRNPDLDIIDLYLLDSVQKKKSISDEDAARLRKNGLITGRKPNYRLPADDTKLDYDEVRVKILSVIGNSPDGISRADIDMIDFGQKEVTELEITYTIRSLVKSGKIQNTGSKKKPIYRLR